MMICPKQMVKQLELKIYNEINVSGMYSLRSY